MLNILVSVLLTFSNLNPVKVHVENHSTIQTIEDRNVTFGIKETVEEILSTKGYNPVSDTSDGMDVWVSIDSIYSPQQMLNIIGLKWLRKDYIVVTTVCMGTRCNTGEGKRHTYVFAAFLDVENNEVPLNRKAFSKSLQSSLESAFKSF